MTKRLIDLDDELVETAQRELGTRTVAETVRVALHEAAARRARSRQVDWLSQGGLADMADPERRETVWR